MKLTQEALDTINEPQIRMRIALELGVADKTIVRYINSNENNNPLTTAGALKVIREITDLTDEDILEEVKETA